MSQQEKLSLTMAKTENKRGVILVLTGGGKGKTSSAFGLALRSAGHGMKVCIIQFMKGRFSCGEKKAVEKMLPDIELHVSGKGFYEIPGDRHPADEHRTSAKKALKLAQKKMASGAYDVIILDEINVALNMGLLEMQEVLSIIENKPPTMHLILTGRDAHPKVIDLADTVTEMKEVKHAFRKGLKPVKGIDF